jgi:hypothetical protein
MDRMQTWIVPEFVGETAILFRLATGCQQQETEHDHQIEFW